VTTVALALGLLAAPAAPVPREVKKEALIGVWEQVSVETPEAKVPDDLVWTFEKDKVTLRRRSDTDKVFSSRALDADAGKDPKEITLTSEHGGKKWVQHGIYKFDGDRLTICFGVAVGDAAVNESKRPTEYKAGPDTCLVVLKKGEK
jgi:uncharacterized protein (TIGR03067 family)